MSGNSSFFDRCVKQIKVFYVSQCKRYHQCEPDNNIVSNSLKWAIDQKLSIVIGVGLAIYKVYKIVSSSPNSSVSNHKANAYFPNNNKEKVHRDSITNSTSLLSPRRDADLLSSAYMSFLTYDATNPLVPGSKNAARAVIDPTPTLNSTPSTSSESLTGGSLNTGDSRSHLTSEIPSLSDGNSRSSGDTEGLQPTVSYDIQILPLNSAPSNPTPPALSLKSKNLAESDNVSNSGTVQQKVDLGDPSTPTRSNDPLSGDEDAANPPENNDLNPSSSSSSSSSICLNYASLNQDITILFSLYLLPWHFLDLLTPYREYDGITILQFPRIMNNSIYKELQDQDSVILTDEFFADTFFLAAQVIATIPKICIVEIDFRGFSDEHIKRWAIEVIKALVTNTTEAISIRGADLDAYCYEIADILVKKPAIRYVDMADSGISLSSKRDLAKTFEGRNNEDLIYKQAGDWTQKSLGIPKVISTIIIQYAVTHKIDYMLDRNSCGYYSINSYYTIFKKAQQTSLKHQNDGRENETTNEDNGASPSNSSSLKGGDASTPSGVIGLDVDDTTIQTVEVPLTGDHS